MTTTTPPNPAGPFRIIATQVHRHTPADVAAIAYGGGVVRDERRHPEPHVQMWVNGLVMGVPGAMALHHNGPPAGDGFYAHELRYPTLPAALDALSALVACNRAVRDGAKRLKVLPA